MQKYFWHISFFLIFFLLLLPKTSLAARNVSIESANKTALFGDEEVILNASPSGFTDGETIYIKGAFYQEGGTNYFGYTKNGDNWIKNGESTTSQRQVKIGEWDKNLIFKSDFSDSGYKGEGNYKLKLGFYYLTSGGNLSSVNWSSNNLDLNLSEPDPTPTDIPTKEPTPTRTPTPTPFKTPTPTPSIKPTIAKTPTKSATKSANLSGIPTSVLGSTDKAPDKNKEEKKKIMVASESKNKLRFYVLTAGLLLLACAILVFLKDRKGNHG